MRLRGYDEAEIAQMIQEDTIDIKEAENGGAAYIVEPPP
nr:MAG TPA: hypothetical protein [Caudoviricetes sp.]